MTKQEWVERLDDKVFVVVDGSHWDVVNWFLVEELGMSFYCEPQYSIEKFYYVYVNKGVLHLQEAPPLVSERIITGPALEELLAEYRGESKLSDFEKTVRLQVLITEREGMVAENMTRQYKGLGLAYGVESFTELEDRMEALLKK